MKKIPFELLYDCNICWKKFKNWRQLKIHKVKCDELLKTNRNEKKIITREEKMLDFG